VVIAADDELFDPSSERAAARERLGVEPIEIPGGHFPMAEDPFALAALLDQLARSW
jgi:pimeloyl-ACP methyl ester carboxylesterase